jgi:hypothetical protein
VRPDKDWAGRPVRVLGHLWGKCPPSPVNSMRRGGKPRRETKSTINLGVRRPGPSGVNKS